MHQTCDFGCHSPPFILRNKQTTSDWLTGHCGTVGTFCNLPLFPAWFVSSRLGELAVTHTIVIWSRLYILQNFPLVFAIIFCSSSTKVSHGSRSTSARCKRLQILSNDTRLNQIATHWDTAATKTPVSPLQRRQCSHCKYDLGPTCKNHMWNRKQLE